MCDEDGHIGWVGHTSHARRKVSGSVEYMDVFVAQHLHAHALLSCICHVLNFELQKGMSGRPSPWELIETCVAPSLTTRDKPKSAICTVSTDSQRILPPAMLQLNMIQWHSSVQVQMSGPSFSPCM